MSLGQKRNNSSCPNLIRLLDWFDYVSSLIATTICTSEKCKERVKLISKEIAVKLRKMGNLNSFMQIISGLRQVSVARMVPTFEVLDPKDTKELEDQFQLADITNNYSKIREALLDMDRPCIPFVWAYLEELVEIEGQDTINPEASLINFQKRQSIARGIKWVLFSRKSFHKRATPLCSHFECHGLVAMSAWVEPTPGNGQPLNSQKTTDKWTLKKIVQLRERCCHL